MGYLAADFALKFKLLLILKSLKDNKTVNIWNMLVTGYFFNDLMSV